MQPPQKHSCVDLGELKNEIIKQIGLEKSQQYFDYLKRFLSLKLSKVEFDKLCLRTVGRDNISLHNQLIRLILKNACTRKVPPTSAENKKVYHENGLVPVVHSKHQTESFGRKSGKEASARSSLHPPLGIPDWPVGGSRKSSSLSSTSKCVTDGLIETVRLKERMDQLAATQGLQGVSAECASMLNNGLDAYLKGLIRSFIELSGARSGVEPMKNGSINHQAHFRPLNGIRSGHHYQIQSRMQEPEPKRPVSLLDLTVAMELNPQQLGEDWPILLEKICTHAFEE
uniref:uncharacterized protein LOC122588660 n=1 Tax=Erigeron canadensis TaxID=72917 RepID=UPI001CB93F34|nr:uncharacterized protein LOC122588660 [Erigeron canadensis]